MVDPIPHANLLIFKSSQKTDIAYVAEALALDARIKALAAKSAQTAVYRYGTWKLSSAGQVTATSLRAHVDWLLDVAIRANEDALQQLRKEGFWTSVLFHDYVPPDPLERARIDQKLELINITFDFELERR
jgi:hypothetical protein